MPGELATVLQNLLASYHQAGGINHIDGSNMPSKEAVTMICSGLLQLLFPGFLDKEPLHSCELEAVTSDRFNRLFEQLLRETCKSLRRGPCQNSTENLARKIVIDFFNTLPEVRKLLSTDVQAAYEGDPAASSFEEIILTYPCIEAIAIQRLAHTLYKQEVPLLPRIMTEWAHSRTGIDIHPGATISSHFFIDHGTGVVIGETCTIGSHVKLYHGVTLGGETIIGEGSTIGGNVFLTRSVPPYSLVYYEEKQLTVLQKPVK